MVESLGIVECSVNSNPNPNPNPLNYPQALYHPERNDKNQGPLALLNQHDDQVPQSMYRYDPVDETPRWYLMEEYCDLREDYDISLELAEYAALKFAAFFDDVVGKLPQM